MTTAAQIRKLQEDRTNNSKGDEGNVSRQLYRDDEETARIDSNHRVQAKRMLKAQNVMQQETEMHESLMRMERDRLVKEQQAEQEERLAKELERRHLQTLREEKSRQHIRETSEEIRELERKLKAAYTNKERAAQIAHKQARLAAEKLEHSDTGRKIQEAAEEAMREEAESEEKRVREKLRYQQELERQMEQQEVTKQEAYQQFLKDKLMIDEIVRKIYEEDQREVEKELQKQKKTKEYMEEFRAAREVWTKRENAKMEEENRKIQEYAKLQKDRDAAFSSNKHMIEAAKTKILHALSEEISQKEREREEMETVRLQLIQEEEDKKERELQKTAWERQLRAKQDLQQAYAKELYLKGLRQQQAQDEEHEFNQQMLDKMAEDERLERLSAEKRRLRQLEHKRSLQTLMDERRAEFAADREREALERAEEQRLERERQRLVEEERQRLLREHATRLLGHLPKGVIQGEEDLKMLGPEFTEAYAARCFNPFNEIMWHQPK